MAREKPYYRETLERLDERFPDKEVLSRDELAAYLGCSTRTVNRRWQKFKNKITGGYTKSTIAAVLAAQNLM